MPKASGHQGRSEPLLEPANPSARKGLISGTWREGKLLRPRTGALRLLLALLLLSRAA